MAHQAAKLFHDIRVHQQTLQLDGTNGEVEEVQFNEPYISLGHFPLAMQNAVHMVERWLRTGKYKEYQLCGGTSTTQILDDDFLKKKPKDPFVKMLRESKINTEAVQKASDVMEKLCVNGPKSLLTSMGFDVWLVAPRERSTCCACYKSSVHVLEKMIVPRFENACSKCLFPRCLECSMEMLKGKQMTCKR